MENELKHYEECVADFIDLDQWTVAPRKLYRRTSSGDRFYYFQNQEGKIQGVPSVTTVLGVFNKPYLEKWKVEKGFEYFTILEQLGNYGTMFHAVAFLPWKNIEEFKLLSYREGREKYVRDFCEKNFPHIEPTKAYIDSSTKGNWFIQLEEDLICWMNFIREYDVKPIACEIALASERIGIACQLDMVCEMNFNRKRVLAIADIKTSRSGVFEDHGIQLHIQRECLKDNFNIEGYSPDEIMLFNWRPTTKSGERTNWTDNEKCIAKAGILPQVAKVWFEPKDKKIISLREGFNFEDENFTNETTTFEQLEKLFTKEIAL